MQYLKFQDNVTVSLTVTSVDPTPHPKHWAGNTYVDCVGPNCQLCVGGVRKDVRHSLEVSVAGIQYTWDCPEGAWNYMVSLTGDLMALVGMALTVTRVKANNRTVYQITPTGSTPPQPTPQAMAFGQDVSGFLGVLDACIRDPRFAGIIASLLPEGELPL